VGIPGACRAYPDICHRHALAFQLCAGVQDGWMFDCRRDDVPGGIPDVPYHAKQREVVGFSASADEYNFLRLCGDERGYLAARHLQPLLGDLAEMMDTG